MEMTFKLFNPDARPRAYWINSSGNSIIRTLLQKATPQTRMELDRLVNGRRCPGC